jgi:ABC-2 type transport system permease protein
MIGPGLSALIELRLRLFWRRLVGRGGVAETVGTAVGFAMVIPASLGFAAIAAYGCYRGARGGVTGFHASMALALFALWQLWTVLALTVDEGGTFDLRRLLPFPIRPSTVYFYGLLTGFAGDPIAWAMIIPIGAAWVGAAVGRPGVWVIGLGLAFIAFVAATIGFIALLAELLARLSHSRRGRELAMAALVLLIMVGLVAGSLLGDSRGLASALRRSLPVVQTVRWAALPPTLAAEASRQFFRGHLLSGMGWTLLLAGAGTLFGWLAYRLALSSALSGGASSAAEPGEKGEGWRLPGLTDRFAALLEKEVKYLLRHPLARLSLVLLPAVAAFVAWKLAAFVPEEAGEVVRALPLFGISLYTHLVHQPFWLNGFGWERGGCRLYFTAPVSPRSVLLAKNLALLGFSFGVYLFSLAIYTLVGGMAPAWALLAAPVLHLALAPMLYGVGNLLSVLHPKSVPFGLQRGGRVPALSGLAAMLSVSATGALFGLPVLVAIHLEEPWALLGAWTAIGLAAALVYWRALAAEGRLLAGRKEQLMAVIAGDDI